MLHHCLSEDSYSQIMQLIAKMEKNSRMMKSPMLMKMCRIMSLNEHKYSLMYFETDREEHNCLNLESYYCAFIVIPMGY